MKFMKNRLFWLFASYALIGWPLSASASNESDNTYFSFVKVMLLFVAVAVLYLVRKRGEPRK
jgi:uncharacterized membrane protein YfcA